ncbi:protein trichome birefringence-like 19 isoform X2 [Salvia miltiorrhiza]|uniref:protein trichome birefringence-like 19 isoform X2 n=1 Tax=Salvia miltiorrhiza TaxID=226208 RepID=UPI0025AC443A|nr:protein trichome birefringence-like 19 isoform X2 [Salvia miltiorrhiza]
MKLEALKPPLPKPQTRIKTSKFIPLIALTCLLTIIPIYYPFSHKKLLLALPIGNENTIKSTSPLLPPPKPNTPTRRRSDSSAPPECDLFDGEWIPNPDGPYYTNETCDAIQEHQNCMKFGRPDTGYLKWRWKPDGCELPLFHPNNFLEMLRGKSLLFVGDSVARNHMQSLICLLSKVAQPIDVSEATAENRLYRYTDYNLSISIISSPYLIRTHKTDPNDFTAPYHLFLDEFDPTWTAALGEFDYLIISAAHWFFRPSYFHLNGALAGCLYCSDPNVTRLPSSFAYRRALRTALRALDSFRGVAFLRTLAPSHFEGGPWDRGGDCARRRPFRRNETALEEFAAEVYRIQLEELERGKGKGNVRLFDATKVMVVRADGHPSKYGRWAAANQTVPNDCVHWCLPGPIDAWNDFLQELLRRELEGYYTSSL